MTTSVDTGGNPFHLTVDGFPADHLRVESFVGREVLSQPYAFDVVATVETPSDEELERLALGQRAVFTWDVGKGERALYGVVAAVRLAEVHDAGTRVVQYHLRVVPRLWLLKRRRRTRIFQGLRVTEIVDAVLREAGIATRWQLLREYPAREYCTQYEESDLHFVKRLCAEAGLYFYFPQGPTVDASAAAASLVPGDTVVFADDASFYPAIAGDDPAALAALPSPAGAAAAVSAAPTLYFLSMQETAASHLDNVTHFSARTVVKATSAAYRDYDPERPQARLSSAAMSTAPFPAPEAAPPAADGSVATFAAGAAGQGTLGLEVYDHHGPFLFPKWSFAADEAALMLRQKRRRASTAHGESGCPDLSAGHRFALAEHSATHLDRAYALTSVDHHGFARPSAASKQRIYWNVFTCVPAEVTFVPPRPRRKSIQVALTAVVVGPPGEEVHVDAAGQIKVQFHWDREGGYDDRSSCWIRTMHAWGGAGWGAQFIPRVGMEVVVTFEGGDPDKPMVLGSLYNGTHPPPFMLPAEKTRSGIRTQTSPGGGGNNELSFEDRAGGEQIYVHAQRDLDEVAERNHTLLVRGDERLRVLGSRMDIVEEDVIARVARNVEEHVGGDRNGQVEGNRIDVVTGNSDERVSGMLVTRVEGKERRSIQKNADLEYAEDLTTRVLGCLTTLVGKSDKKRSWVTHAEGTAKLSSLDATEVSSEGELVLRVGKSSIRITAEKIEIDAPAVTVKGKGGGVSADDDGLKLSSKKDAQVLVEKKLVLKSKEGASLSMEKEVKVDGKQILLNSPEEAQDPPPKDPEPPTKIELKDDEGKPLAYQRFLVVMDDGSEVSGTTDKDGKAEPDLKSGGKVMFPDVTMPGDESDKGDLRPCVVQQGDYLMKLAWMGGFDAEKVWNDPKNEELKTLRGNHHVLAPGDVVHVPVKKKTGMAISKGETNAYTAKVPQIEVVLAFKGTDGKPLASEPCEVRGLGGTFGADLPKDVTDGDGKLTLKVPVTVREVGVHFPQQNVTYEVRIGEMDPVSELSGVKKRLHNLGFWYEDPEIEMDADEMLRLAVKRFQSEDDPDASGALDDDKKKALEDGHGL